MTVFEALNLDGVKDSMNIIKRGMHFHVTFVLLRSHTAEARNRKHFSSYYKHPSNGRGNEGDGYQNDFCGVGVFSLRRGISH